MFSVRNLPKNLKKNDLYLFEHELKKKLNSYQILNYRTAYISNKLLIADKKIFNREVYLQKLKKIDLIKYLVRETTSFFLRKKQIITLENKFFVTTDHSNVYFHWMTEVLSKIVFLQNNVTKPNILVDEKLIDYDFVKLSLALLNVKYTLIEPKFLYKIKNFKFVNFDTPSGNFDKKIINELSSKLKFKNDVSKIERIWISRRSLADRFIENEDELHAILEKFQILLVDPNNLDYGEQIKLFQNCKFLSGIHGGGLANMIYMPENSTVLEVRQPKDDKNNCYFTLSSDLDHQYFYLESEYSKVNNQNNFYLNPKILEKELQKIFKH